MIFVNTGQLVENNTTYARYTRYLQEGPKKLKETYAMVHGRGRPPSEAKKRREAALGSGDEAVLRGISRKKPGCNPGILEYKS